MSVSEETSVVQLSRLKPIKYLESFTINYVSFIFVEL